MNIKGEFKKTKKDIENMIQINDKAIETCNNIIESLEIRATIQKMIEKGKLEKEDKMVAYMIIKDYLEEAGKE